MARCGWCLTAPAGWPHYSCRRAEYGRCDCEHEVRTGRYYWPPSNRHVAACPRCHWGRPFSDARTADIAYVKHTCVIVEKGATTVSKSMIETAFEQLDAQVDEIVADKAKFDGPIGPSTISVAELDLEVAKARARGKAEILALFMAPHFTTADDIAAESGRRRAARLAGVAYVTPGLTIEQNEVPS